MSALHSLCAGNESSTQANGGGDRTCGGKEGWSEESGNRGKEQSNGADERDEKIVEEVRSGMSKVFSEIREREAIKLNVIFHRVRETENE